MIAFTVTVTSENQMTHYTTQHTTDDEWIYKALLKSYQLSHWF